MVAPSVVADHTGCAGNGGGKKVVLGIRIGLARQHTRDRRQSRLIREADPIASENKSPDETASISR